METSNNNETLVASVEIPEYILSAANTLIQPILENCRPNYDLPHTMAVVYWANILSSKQPQINRNCLLTAAYLHDIGYYALFNRTAELSEVRNRKSNHMELGAIISDNLLKNPLFDYLSEEEKKYVIYLVSIHDKGETVENSNLAEALVLLEADTLGALDINQGAKPSFVGTDAINYLKTSIPTRKKRFRSDIAIKESNDLIKKYATYILKRDISMFNIHEIRDTLQIFDLKREDFVEPTSHPNCIFLRGLPGAGKSTLARELAKNRTEKNEVTFTYLNPDELHINEEKVEEVDSITYKKRKYRKLLESCIKSLLLGKSVVWDQPWSSLEGLNDTLFNLDYFLSPEWAKAKIIEIKISEQTSKKRTEERIAAGGHGPSANTLAKIHSAYTALSESKSHEYTVFILDGETESIENNAKELETIMKH